MIGNLISLNYDERAAVAAMIVSLYTIEDDDKENLVIGDHAENLPIYHLKPKNRRKVCEKLVEKNIFVRHQGEYVVSTAKNEPIGDDNWYSFNSELVDVCDRQKVWSIFGGFLFEHLDEYPDETLRIFFEELARGILESTYL